MNLERANDLYYALVDKMRCGWCEIFHDQSRLDGEFTAEELEAVAFLMREREKQIEANRPVQSFIIKKVKEHYE